MAWLRNRLISAEKEPVLIHPEKSCIVSYYRQFSTSIKIKKGGGEREREKYIDSERDEQKMWSII